MGKASSFFCNLVRRFGLCISDAMGAFCYDLLDIVCDYCWLLAKLDVNVTSMNFEWLPGPTIRIPAIHESPLTFRYNSRLGKELSPFTHRRSFSAFSAFISKQLQTQDDDDTLDITNTKINDNTNTKIFAVTLNGETAIDKPDELNAYLIGSNVTVDEHVRKITEFYQNP